MLFILFPALISFVCSYPWNEHENTCIGISKLETFLKLCKSAINQSPKGEPVLYFEEMRRNRFGKLTPFKQQTTWRKLFQNHHSPVDLSQAVACYCLSHYPYVRVINLKERPIKQKALGWGVRATIDIPAFTLLVGYQGLEHIIGDLDDDLLWRIRQVNDATMDAEYTLTVDNTDYLIEGAPAVALYHEKRVSLSDKSTKVLFCLGPLVNGSPNPNVEWSQIELDGQPLVMFYAKRKIGKGQELFVDYGEEYMAENQIN
ncbi:unnamed protein product, partial [Mesorhabditis belari]|uniref:SET domain-containing protein n=1 Tax=Mesorhabditis belari TaxID=2138241 RepID=A0AAF3J362_9BILA